MQQGRCIKNVNVANCGKLSKERFSCNKKEIKPNTASHCKRLNISIE